MHNPQPFGRKAFTLGAAVCRFVMVLQGSCQFPMKASHLPMKHPTKTCRRVEGGGARGLHLSDFDAVLLVPHVGGCSVKPWTGFAAILRPVFEVPDTTKWGHLR